MKHRPCLPYNSFLLVLFYYLIMTIIKLSIKKRKHKKTRRSSAELHEVLPTLKLFKEKKPEKKEIKTVSEQSQDELEPIEGGIPYPILEDENK